MGDRAVYCARLESVCAERHPGFESPPIRRTIFSGLTSSEWKDFAMRFSFALLFLVVVVSPVRAEETPLRSASLLEKARNDFRAADFEGALTLLDQIDKVEKKNADALDLRGTIYLQQNKFEEAKNAFRAANEANTARFLPRLHLGDVSLREKKFAEARGLYENLLRETNIQLGSEKLRYGILLTYLFASDESHARAALERIKFPTESPAYYYAQAVWEFGHQRPSEGRKWVAAANRMFDAKASAWFAQPLYDFGWIKDKPPLVSP
jgi:tetratricopeptide (TPR) repeat protein